jgi:hypothetical protein
MLHRETQFSLKPAQVVHCTRNKTSSMTLDGFGRSFLYSQRTQALGKNLLHAAVVFALLPHLYNREKKADVVM